MQVALHAESCEARDIAGYFSQGRHRDIGQANARRNALRRTKNGTVTSMPRGFERICLVLGASYTWTFIVVPARIYAGSDPVRPFAARLPEQCFPECGAFPGPMGQAGAGWHPSDARPVCSSD